MTKRIALAALALSLPLAACGDADDPAVITTDETITIDTPDMDGAMDDMGDAVDGAVEDVEGAAMEAGDTMEGAADDAAETMEGAADEAATEMEEAEEEMEEEVQ